MKRLPLLKKLSLIAALGVFALLAALAWMSRPDGSPVQKILTPDGKEIMYLGATYGTNHWNPMISRLERWFIQIPGSVQHGIPNFLTRRVFRRPTRIVNQQSTPTPTAVLWFYCPTNLTHHLTLQTGGHRRIISGPFGSIPVHLPLNTDVDSLQVYEDYAEVDGVMTETYHHKLLGTFKLTANGKP